MIFFLSHMRNVSTGEKHLPRNFDGFRLPGRGESGSWNAAYLFVCVCFYMCASVGSGKLLLILVSTSIPGCETFSTVTLPSELWGPFNIAHAMCAVLAPQYLNGFYSYSILKSFSITDQ
jgi:hypothetical protein